MGYYTFNVLGGFHGEDNDAIIKGIWGEIGEEVVEEALHLEDDGMLSAIGISPRPSQNPGPLDLPNCFFIIKIKGYVPKTEVLSGGTTICLVNTLHMRKLNSEYQPTPSL